jgi:hypothetical protein
MLVQKSIFLFGLKTGKLLLLKMIMLNQFLNGRQLQ